MRGKKETIREKKTTKRQGTKGGAGECVCGGVLLRRMMLSVKSIPQLGDLAFNIWLAQIFLFSSNGKHSDKRHLH